MMEDKIQQVTNLQLIKLTVKTDWKAIGCYKHKESWLSNNGFRKFYPCSLESQALKSRLHCFKLLHTLQSLPPFR